MTHLLIKNKGLVESGDLMLIGSSTKRNDNTKIGMFGSGWKYALAWFLRNDIEIKIFSGEKEIKIDYDIMLHRDKPIRVLNVDGEKTSITAEMGPQWTGWMALREIVSNAIDEGDYQVNSMLNCNFEGEKDVTSIYIPLNNELSTVVRNYDYYFAFDRKPHFSNIRGSIYLKSESDASVIYRKGIRCIDSSGILSEMDFDFNNIYINESRVTDNYEIRKEMNAFVRLGVPKDILLSLLKARLLMECTPSENNLETVKELIDDGHNFIPIAQLAFGGLMGMSDEDIVIADDWYRKLVERGWINSKLKLGDFIYKETKLYNTKEVEYHLQGIGLTNIKVICGNFHKYISDIKLLDNYTIIVRDSMSSSPKQVAAMCLNIIDPTILEVIFK